jgi:bacitracin transport system permease protein
LLNVLANECLKLKSNKLLPVCTFLALILPGFMLIVDLMDKSFIIANMSWNDWLFRLVLPIQVIVYPVLSGFVLTFLIQKEYSEKTIINTLTAPTSRIIFLLGKYTIWVSWVLIITIGFLALTYAGVYSLFGKVLFQESIARVTELIIKIGILNLLSMSALLITCILQRSVFYPSLLFSCLVAGMGFSGLYWPEMIRDIIPWSAVTSITILNTQTMLPYTSILIGHFIGLLLSIYFFVKQDL